MGSEMCIRDSPTSPACSCLRLHGAELHRAEVTCKQLLLRVLAPYVLGHVILDTHKVAVGPRPRTGELYSQQCNASAGESDCSSSILSSIV